MYSHLIHLGDIHIRCGDKDACRYEEYRTVFKRLFETLQNLPCVKDETALIVICGDIFHNKYKLETYSVRLWNHFMNQLTKLAPVILICGNHDYRQEDPTHPDLIDVMCESLQENKHPFYYFKETNIYRLENIQFGLVSIKDTLKTTSTSGIEEDLPTFPSPIFKDCVSVALFHGTITQSKLPNGMEMKAGHGYPLEWFKGYDMLLLGDNHKQQIHTSSWGMPWGYPGSLVQQDIGEPLHGHGFLLWDIKEKSATPYHIDNPYGKIKLKMETMDLFVKINPEQKKYLRLADVVKTCPFPSTPHITFYGTIGEHQETITVLKSYGIYPKTIRILSPLLNDTATAGLPADADTLKDISTLNNPERWLEYLTTINPSLTTIIQEKRWMESPSTLMIDAIPVELSKDLHELIGKVREKLQGYIDAYETHEHTVPIHAHKVVLKHLSWNWVYSYGKNNWFNFETMEGSIGILNGKNASGKSSFIDTLCIALFGEPTPNRQMNTSRKITSHCIHTGRPTGPNGESMSLKVLFTVDSQWYEIHRKYLPSIKETECKCISVELYRILPDSQTELIHSGSTLVNQWVEKHLGTMEDLVKTSIVTQMDSHNFFFAKPEQQKSMIDHAVHLKGLDDYSKIIHEAYNAYTLILKTATTVVNTAEEHLDDPQIIQHTLLTEEEYSKLTDDRQTLEKHIDQLEKTKELCFIQLNPFISTEASAPLPSPPVASLEHLQSQETLAEGNYKNLLSTKPNIERSKHLLEQDSDHWNQWHQRFQTYLDDPAAYAEARQTYEMERAQHEKELEEWKSLSIPKMGFAAAEASNAEANTTPVATSKNKRVAEFFPEDATWIEKRAIYHTMLTRYEKIEQLKSSLDTQRTPNKEHEWIQRYNEYQQWLKQCAENDWTDIQMLQANLQQTLEYQQKRLVEENRLALYQTELHTHQEILSKYPTWKKEKLAWKRLDKTYRSKNYTLPFIAKELQRIQRQSMLYEKDDQRIAELEQNLQRLQEHPWWEEWRQWNQRKSKWVTEDNTMSLTSLRERYERQLTYLQEKQRLEKEQAAFLAKDPHPKCKVCKKRQDELREAIEALPLETELHQSIEHIQTTIADLKSLERTEPMMEHEYRHRKASLTELNATLTSLYTARDERPTAEQQLAEQTHFEEIQTYLMEANEKRAFYERMEESSLCQITLQKKIKKLTEYLQPMETTESLKHTEHYWREAMNTRTLVERMKPTMETEAISWEHARKKQQHYEKEMRKLTATQNGILPTKEDLSTCHQHLYKEWESVGNLLSQKKESLDDLLNYLQTYERERDDYRVNVEKLAKEYLAWEAFEKWNVECEARLEAYRDAKYKRLLKEVHILSSLIQEAKESYHTLNTKWIQHDIYKSLTAQQSKVQEMTQRKSVLQTYIQKWRTECEWLRQLDLLLVGERGFKATQKLPHVTYKEWIYENRVLPILEQHVNHFLAQLNIELVFKIAYKAKALEFSVLDRGNETSFASCSGFQQFIIGLGMRQALSIIGGAGNNIKHMFIDEGFTAADADNIEKSHDILQLLITQANYKSILLVSHLDAIKDTIGLKIPLYREGAFSRLQYGPPYPTHTSSVKRKGRPCKNTVPL